MTQTEYLFTPQNRNVVILSHILKKLTKMASY